MGRKVNDGSTLATDAENDPMVPNQLTKLQKYSAPALEKGLDILELLSLSASEMSLSQIAAGVGRSKNEIFRAVVSDLSDQVRKNAANRLAPDLGALAKEAAALSAFLTFARTHKEIYRIIDEAEFVDADSFRAHYETTAQRIFERLKQGVERGELRPDMEEAHAWAVMGMNVFLGMRYSIWSDSMSIEHITNLANSVLRCGIANPDSGD